MPRIFAGLMFPLDERISRIQRALVLALPTTVQCIVRLMADSLVIPSFVKCFPVRMMFIAAQKALKSRRFDGDCRAYFVKKGIIFS